MAQSPDTLTQAEIACLRAALDRLGEAALVARLRVGRPALARVLAALPVRAGTISLVRSGLEKLSSESEEQGQEQGEQP